MVRVHPRDRVEAWSERGFAVVTSDDESMETSILGSDLVLAMVSTGLLEAVSLGRIARAVIIADRYESYERSFVADPFLAAIRTATDLRSALTAYRSAIDPAAYDRQQAGLEPYVAASGRDAAERVAAVVADLTR